MTNHRLRHAPPGQRPAQRWLPRRALVGLACLALALGATAITAPGAHAAPSPASPAAGPGPACAGPTGPAGPGGVSITGGTFTFTFLPAVVRQFARAGVAAVPLKPATVAPVKGGGLAFTMPVNSTGGQWFGSSNPAFPCGNSWVALASGGMRFVNLRNHKTLDLNPVSAYTQLPLVFFYGSAPSDPTILMFAQLDFSTQDLTLAGEGATLLNSALETTVFPDPDSLQTVGSVKVRFTFPPGQS